MTRPLLFALVLTLGPIGCQEITIVDNECDADEADLWFLDEDGDGFGITDDFIVACTGPDGYVLEDGDCDGV